MSYTNFSIMKYLIEGLDDFGTWNKFNYFEGSMEEMREKAATVILRTKYIGVRITKA
jgi:hypothetical protein